MESFMVPPLAELPQHHLMKQKHYISELKEYLFSSPTPFHAISSAIHLLERNGFVRLHEEEIWQPLPSGKYVVTRDDSSLIAFIKQAETSATALHMVGAHTDSPGLKIKPKPLQHNQNYLQFGVEVYGGALLNPWFDRELSLAGRICWQDRENTLRSTLVNCKHPIAIIPSLAIHLDREANKKHAINTQKNLVPILGLTDDNTVDIHTILQKLLYKEHPDLDLPEIIDHDLFFYDAAPPLLTGLDQEFITGARLDNLLSCFAAVQALVLADSAENCMIILNDHEEVGSLSTTGARGPFLRDILARLFPDEQCRQAVLRQSLLISADNAHAVHPNFSDKHDAEHQPLMGQGPAIKFNANQRYATSAATAARFRQLCNQAAVPVQEFVMRNDMACGSTTGPLTAAEIGVDTVDIGIPTLAMHSIRETAACSDCWFLFRALHTFLNAKFC